MAPRAFSLTYDYRCPFARIASLHVLDGLEAGAPWEVTWVPFSLAQAHVAEGDPPMWDRPEADSGLLALQVAAAVAAQAPDRFGLVHRDLFDHRHIHHGSLTDPDALGAILESHGIDPAAIWEALSDGGPLDSVHKAHERAVTDHDVWGVPTFIVGDQAVFVRLMSLVATPQEAVTTVDRILDLVDGWPLLNEFKHTSIPR